MKKIFYIVLGIVTAIAWTSCGHKKNKHHNNAPAVIDTTFLHNVDTVKYTESLPLPPPIEQPKEFEFKWRVTKTDVTPFNKELRLDQANHVFISGLDSFPTTKEYIINESSTSFKYIFDKKPNKCTIYKDRIETEVATYIKDTLSDYSSLRKRFVTCVDHYKSVASGATWKQVANYYLLDEKTLRRLNPNQDKPKNKFVFKRVCQ